MTHARFLLNQGINRLVPHMRGLALDVGGEKVHSIEGWNRPALEWTYLNSHPRYEPDILGSAENIPRPSDTFDTVVAFELLEHVEDVDRTLDEAIRVLKPGGRLFLSMPFMYRHHPNSRDFRRWTHEQFFIELEKKRGLRVESVHPRGAWLAVGMDLLSQGISGIQRGCFKGSTILWVFGKVVNRLVYWTRPLWLKADRFLANSRVTHSYYHRFTTGYVVMAQKPEAGQVFERRSAIPDYLDEMAN